MKEERPYTTNHYTVFKPECKNTPYHTQATEHHWFTFRSGLDDARFISLSAMSLSPCVVAVHFSRHTLHPSSNSVCSGFNTWDSSVFTGSNLSEGLDISGFETSVSLNSDSSTCVPFSCSSISGRAGIPPVSDGSFTGVPLTPPEMDSVPSGFGWSKKPAIANGI